MTFGTILQSSFCFGTTSRKDQPDFAMFCKTIRSLSTDLCEIVIIIEIRFGDTPELQLPRNQCNCGTRAGTSCGNLEFHPDGWIHLEKRLSFWSWRFVLIQSRRELSEVHIIHDELVTIQAVSNKGSWALSSMCGSSKGRGVA